MHLGAFQTFSLRPDTIKKTTLQHSFFSCEFCEMFKNTLFTGHLQTTGSEKIDKISRG